MSKPTTKTLGLDDVNHLWNIALDNFEDGGNEGQESFVGDDNENGSGGNSNQQHLAVGHLPKLNPFKPNPILVAFVSNTMPQGSNDLATSSNPIMNVQLPSQQLPSFNNVVLGNM
jgi:hypothetical protein